MHDKCPHCGADRCKVGPLTHVYVCGSSEHLRHTDCYEREIKSLRKSLARMQPVVDAVIAMLAIDKEHRFQAISEVIEAGEKYKEAE